MSAPDTLNKAIQSLTPGMRVELFKLDMTVMGYSGPGSIQYFTRQSRDGANIVFDGDTYVSTAMKAEGFEISGRGTMPRPKMMIANVANVAGILANTYDDLIGSEVTRIRTFEQFIDDGANPDPSAILPIEIFEVSRIVKRNKIMIEWELRAVNDLEGEQIPKRRVWKNMCPFIYRRWTGAAFDYSQTSECPYTAATYLKADGTATGDPAEDKCGKALRDCKLRFGNNAVLPFGGFPGTKNEGV